MAVTAKELNEFNFDAPVRDDSELYCWRCRAFRPLADFSYVYHSCCEDGDGVPCGNEWPALLCEECGDSTNYWDLIKVKP